MSDPKMMSVTEAREWLDPSTGPKPEVPSPLLVDRYARTIVHLAEQIERLQEAVEHALYYSTEFTSDLIQSGIVTIEDMGYPAVEDNYDVHGDVDE